MEEEDNIIVKWAQEDVETSCNLLNNIKSFRSHYGPGVDSASNRNEYQEHFLGVLAVGT